MPRTIDEDGVAVGSCFAGKAGSDRSSGAPAILNDDRLTSKCTKLVEHNTAYRVGSASSREGDDRPDKIGRIVRLRKGSG
jgi:hypothetical protein